MTTRRLAILEREGLTHAPAALRRAFWTRFNRRRGRNSVQIGVVVAGLVAGDTQKAWQRLARLRSVWHELVPAEFRDLTDVESFARGRLGVRVNGKATQFALARRLGPAVVARFNERLGGVRVTKIDYRVRNGKHN